MLRSRAIVFIEKRKGSLVSFMKQRRRQLSNTAEESASNVVSPNTAATAPTTTTLVRHGPGDGLIKLNVGGKEFVTLRSTVASNAVLLDYVRRAETNGELDAGGAVFVDRDPAHFPVILTFLRNKTEGVAYNSKWKDKAKRHFNVLAAKPKYVRLPKQDAAALEDLYVEAAHFQLRELQAQLCEQSLVTMVASSTGGNPFEHTHRFFTQARRLGLGLVGTGSVVATAQSDWDEWLNKYVPLPWIESSNNKKKEKNVEKLIAAE